MRMNEGVEWALHCCVNLAWVGPDEAVPAAGLAAFYDLPTAYLNKQLQALARAGIVSSTSGPKGGFRLARPAKDITLLDVVTAIDGPEEAFRCREIRRNGASRKLPDDYRQRCLIAQAMREAEVSWRRELAARTIADIKGAVERQAPDGPELTRRLLLRPPRSRR
jgi:Rrf2 family protein